MTIARLVYANWAATLDNPYSWEAGLGHLVGAMPTIVRTPGGAINGSITGVTVEQLDTVSSGVRWVGLVLTGDYEILKDFAVKSAYIRFRTNDGAILTSSGRYGKVALFWGCDKSGAKWVFPEWAVGTSKQIPLPDHNVANIETGYSPLWVAAHRFGSNASAIPNGPFLYALGEATNPDKWIETSQPINGANIAASSPYFIPALSGKLYDNGVYQPPVTTTPTTPPTTSVPVTTDQATKADIANLENRLLTLQQNINTLLTGLGRMPTVQEFRDLMAARGRDNVVLNDNIVTTYNAVLANAAEKIPMERRLAENIGSAAVVKLLLG